MTSREGKGRKLDWLSDLLRGITGDDSLVAESLEPNFSNPSLVSILVYLRGREAQRVSFERPVRTPADPLLGAYDDDVLQLIVDNWPR